MARNVDAKYQTDSGLICLIRMSTGELSAAGTPPTDDLDLPVHALNSGSRRAFGIHPRGMVLERTVGTGDDTFSKYKFVSLLTQTAFNAANRAVGQTVTIDSVTWTIARKVSEALV